MRIEGANNTQNYDLEPVQNNVRVQNDAIRVNQSEKNVEDIQQDGTIAVEINNQNINLKSDNVKISEKILIEAIERANKAIIGTKREFEYIKHPVINAFTVKVIDSETKEVIREIPPEKILDLVANLMELAGVLVDEKR